MYPFVRILISMTIVLGSLTSDVLSADEPCYGGTLRWGTRARPAELNPVITSYSVSASLFSLLFNGLVRVNGRCSIEPDLAESWEVSQDGRVYTFHLRKDVRFHDGTPCTAEDVQFTYSMITRRAGGSPFTASMFADVGWFDVPDKYTFRIGLEKPSATFLYKMTKSIVPRHLLEGIDITTAPFNRFPVGTGMFRFREWLPDDTFVLEANPDYYGGRPWLDRVVVRTFEDTRAVWVALMREEIDFMLFLEQEDYEIVKQDPVFRAHAVPADFYYALSYDLNDPVLSDLRVRRAVAHAVNIDELIGRAAAGYGRPASGPFHPDSTGFDPGVVAMSYDPDRARHLLRSAGWQDNDDDGIFDRNGQPLELRVLVDASRKIDQRIAMVLHQQLCTVGMQVKVVLFRDPAEVTQEFIERHRPQVMLRMMYGGILPDEARPEWDPANARRVFNPWCSGNEEIVALFDTAQLALDEARRAELFHEIHRRLYAEQPVCCLFFPSTFHAVAARFENTDGFFNVNMPHHTMKEWYVPQNKRKRAAADPR